MNYHIVFAALVLAALSNTSLACDNEEVMQKLEEIRQEQWKNCDGYIGNGPAGVPDC